MSDVRIGELVLRVPGLSPQEARALGEAVAERVGRGLAGLGPLELGALDLRLSLHNVGRSAGSDPAEWVEPIAAAILARVGR